MRQKLKNTPLYYAKQQVRRAKRRLVNRRGDGVHSPYAFRLIRQVIRNPHPYHCFGVLAVQKRDVAQALRARYGDRVVASRRVLELVFRLVADSRPRSVALLAPEDSLLPTYIKHAQTSVALLHKSSVSDAQVCEALLGADVIIIEDAEGDDLNRLLEALAQLSVDEASKLVILHQRNPLVRQALKQASTRVSASIQFDLLDLRLWVWRRAVTRGRYKGYC